VGRPYRVRVVAGSGSSPPDKTSAIDMAAAERIRGIDVGGLCVWCGRSLVAFPPNSCVYRILLCICILLVKKNVLYLQTRVTDIKLVCMMGGYIYDAHNKTKYSIYIHTNTQHVHM